MFDEGKEELTDPDLIEEIKLVMRIIWNQIGIWVDKQFSRNQNMAIDLLKFGTFIQQNSNRSFFESKLCQSLYSRDQEFKHKQQVFPINCLNVANRCNI